MYSLLILDNGPFRTCVFIAQNKLTTLRSSKLNAYVCFSIAGNQVINLLKGFVQGETRNICIRYMLLSGKGQLA